MHIAFFDSGLGGLSVAQALFKHPDVTCLQLHQLSYIADTAAYPYGDKADQWLNQRILSVVSQCHQQLEPDMWVIACNTASTLVLDALRQHIHVSIVGVVPAIKPAALASHSKVIGVLATPATVKRNYTAQLIADHAPGCQVILYGSNSLVHESEKKLLGKSLSQSALQTALAALFEQPNGHAIDTIVLGCTHYPLIKTELSALAPNIRNWLDSGEAIARRVISLAANDLLAPRVAADSLAVHWYVTGGPTSQTVLTSADHLTNWLLDKPHNGLQGMSVSHAAQEITVLD